VPGVRPTDLKESLSLSMGIDGAGTLTLQDVQFMNVEAIEGLYAGRKIVRESQWATLGANERTSRSSSPTGCSASGASSTLHRLHPLAQWAKPALAWTILIGGSSWACWTELLMRRQWAEHERFAFPLTLPPKTLFAEETDAQGRVFRPIFRNRVMWFASA